jgi:hypothetical protein
MPQALSSAANGRQPLDRNLEPFSCLTSKFIKLYFRTRPTKDGNIHMQAHISRVTKMTIPSMTLSNVTGISHKDRKGRRLHKGQQPKLSEEAVSFF